MPKGRDTGHYWVKRKGFTRWTVAYYNSGNDYWWVVGMVGFYVDDQFTNINEEKILEPVEEEIR